MRRIVFDHESLRRCLVDNEEALRAQISAYREAGFEIVLSVPGKLPAHEDEGLEEGLRELQALAGLCDALLSGGPDAEVRALHLDDKAVTPEEFLRFRHEELLAAMDSR